jgi:hypothetical protein
MIVDNFDPFGTKDYPGKTDPVSVVDADTILPFSITCQGLELISRRYFEFVQGSDRIELI